MVRTYKQAEAQQPTSPWEQAMRNADTRARLPVHTGRRMYIRNSTFEASSGPAKANVLPPISARASNDHEQLLRIEVGKALNRSESKLDTIVKELILYDQSNTGTVTKIAALEILKRYRVPLEEKDQKRFVDNFLSSDLSRFEYQPAITFMKRSADAAQCQAKQTQDADCQEAVRTRSLARQTNNEAVQQQFSDKIEIGLLIQIENSFKHSNVEPHQLIENLERTLESTCRSERNLVDKMHLKSQLAKHNFPFNTELILKLIDRLDSHNEGSIEWPRFIQFLRQALHEHERTILKQPGMAPAWENHTKLSDIKPKNGFRADIIHDQDFYPNEDLTAFKLQKGSESSTDNLDSAAYKLRTRGRHDKPSIDTAKPDDVPAKPELHNLQTNSMDDRVQIFVQIADALKDKSKHTNGCVNTQEVRKLVNYYNMLFDLNIDLELLESTLRQDTAEGEVGIAQAIKALGRLV